MNDIRQLIPSSPQFPQTGKPRDKRPASKPRTFADHLPPQERGYQTIPNPDVLKKLIDRALNAMKQGVFWDRGSILNIKV